MQLVHGGDWAGYRAEFGRDALDFSANVSPLGLGGLTYGLSTVEMAAAYAAFANSGVYNEPKTYVKVLANDNSTVVLEKETEQRVAMKETTAYLMTNMLYRAVNEYGGTGGGARFSGSTSPARPVLPMTSTTAGSWATPPTTPRRSGWALSKTSGCLPPGTRP